MSADIQSNRDGHTAAQMSWTRLFLDTILCRKYCTNFMIFIRFDRKSFLL